MIVEFTIQVEVNEAQYRREFPDTEEGLGQVAHHLAHVAAFDLRKTMREPYMNYQKGGNGVGRVSVVGSWPRKG